MKPKFHLNKNKRIFTFVGGPRDGEKKAYPSFCGGVRVDCGKDSIQQHYYKKHGATMVYQGLVDKLMPVSRKKS
ncbi:hypothetical protein VPHK251G3_0079 [Vibrio phage K251 g3]